MVPPDPRPAFDARPPTRVPAGLLAVLAACCLLAVIALAIAIHGGSAPTTAGLALAILPIPLVMAGVLYLDRLEPEPPALLAARSARAPRWPRCSASSGTPWAIS